MKLKYYFRGIGIGILVTTIIFICAITVRGGIMTDEKAVNRAMQLGYTKNDAAASGDASEAIKEQLEQHKNNTTASGDAELQAEIQENAQKIADNALDAAENTDTDQPQTADKNDTDSKKQTDSNSDDKEDGSNSKNKNKNSASAPKTKKLVIYSSMGSESVASRLQELGIIDDASDYNKYLIDNGYSRRLQNGTFTIPIGASYQEITRIIT